MSKALINLVGHPVQEYIALGLFLIDLPWISQYGKGPGQYVAALTSHSVNKSILVITQICIDLYWVVMFGN